MKSKVYTNEEAEYEVVFSNAETIIDHYSMEQILADIDDGSIVDAIPTQRDANQWSKKDKGILIHTVLINLSILPISLAQCGTGSGTVKKLIDGKQRTSIFNDFKNDKFALSKACPPVKMRRPVMEEKLDKDGNVVMEKPTPRSKPRPVMVAKRDESGNIVTEEFWYKVAGRKYSELPPSLQKQFNRYKNMPQYVHLNYTDEEIQLQMLRDNTSVKMTPAQVGIVVCGDELATWLHSFREHSLFLDNSTWTDTQERKSLVERCVTEAFVLSVLKDEKWSSSYPQNVDAFKENASEENLVAFKDIADDFSRVISPYPEIAENLNKDNLHIVLTAYCHFCDLDTRYEEKNFAEFLCKWFDSIKDTTEYETEGNTGTKKKTTVLRKLDIIDEECRKYMVSYGTEVTQDTVFEAKTEDLKDNSTETDILEKFVEAFGTEKTDAVCALMELDHRTGYRDDFSYQNITDYIRFFKENPSQELIDKCLKIQDVILNVPLADDVIIDKFNMPVLMELYDEYIHNDNEAAVFCAWLKLFSEAGEPAFAEIGGKMFEDYTMENIDQTSNATIISKYAVLRESYEQYIRTKEKNIA